MFATPLLRRASAAHGEEPRLPPIRACVRSWTYGDRAHAVRPYVRLQACLVREVQVLPWYSHSGQKPTGTAFPRGEVESTWR